MLKYYRKIIITGVHNAKQERPSLQSPGEKPQSANPFALPAMIVGATAAILLLSAFFALLLIPGSIIALAVWRMLRKARNRQEDAESLSAEYTVVKDPPEK